MDKKVLITGFEPFDGNATNPSAELLDFLNNERYSFELKTQLLPVSFTKATPLLKEAVDLIKPTMVIMTGLAGNRTELTIERIGINWVDARIPDNDGLMLKSQKILESGPDGLFSTLPIEVLLENLKSQCPVKISTSAGEYVCNHLLYSYLNLFPDIPGTFIHLPKAEDYQIYFKAILELALTF